MINVTQIILLAFALVLGSSVRAFAAPIYYIYLGVGSGSVGSTVFDAVTFTIIATADTDNIAPWSSADLQNTHLSTTIEIADVGLFSIDTPSHTWILEDCCGGLGRDLATNWITIGEAGFNSVGYGLDTILGPILEENPFSTQFHTVATSGGVLSFTAMEHVTFEALTQAPSTAPIRCCLSAVVSGLLSQRVVARHARRSCGGDMVISVCERRHLCSLRQHRLRDK